MPQHRPVAPEEISTFLIRAVRISSKRERRIYVTSSPQGAAIKMQTFSPDGEARGAPLFIFDRELPEILGALMDAAAAIGATAPARHPIPSTTIRKASP